MNMNYPIERRAITYVNLYIAVKYKDSNNDYYIIANKNILFYKDVKVPEDMGLFMNKILSFHTFNISSYIGEDEINEMLNDDMKGVIFFKFSSDGNKAINELTNIEKYVDLQAYIYDKIKMSDKKSYIEVDLMNSSPSKRGYIETLDDNKVRIRKQDNRKDKDFIVDSKNEYLPISIKIRKEPQNESNIKENNRSRVNKRLFQQS